MAIVFICTIWASFLGDVSVVQSVEEEVSVAQSVETPYIAMLGDVAASVQVRIPRPPDIVLFFFSNGSFYNPFS